MKRILNIKAFEVDITTRCNMECPNCSRRCDLLKPGPDMKPEFFWQQLHTDHKWNHIFIMGGEPTLHPDLLEFVDILNTYCKYSKQYCNGIVVTNTFNEGLLQRANEYEHIFIRREPKEEPQGFWTLNVAPIDFPEFQEHDFSYGCRQQGRCGFQLTTDGWYSCSMEGGIDRVFNFGGSELSEALVDDRFEVFCKYCGRLRLCCTTKENNGTGFQVDRTIADISDYPIHSKEIELSKSYVEALRGIYGTK